MLTGQKHLPVDRIEDPLRLDVEPTEMFHLNLVAAPIVDLEKMSRFTPEKKIRHPSKTNPSGKTIK